ncbi:MAG TPA: hypothetical protein VHE60_12270 [Pyrinomonadaceae bacterium]|nr:hypothetical protein [Pyrinomonadaceae bacterium]
MKKNKIVIVADNSGRIVGCALPYERAARRTSEQETKLVAMPGQTVYEAEIPRELVKHIGRASFVEEIFRYRISPQARLVRAKERRKKSAS